MGQERLLDEPARYLAALDIAARLLGASPVLEERYRKMSSVGARSPTSFNEKVRAAKSRSQKFGHRVQTGYDAGSGHPINVEEELEFEVIPQIIVIVDDLAEILDDLPDQEAIDAMSSLLQQISERGRVAGIQMMRFEPLGSRAS
jgi:S-DNA-T family DNA segregation ATPase FtsK/SpoIIIE